MEACSDQVLQGFIGILSEVLASFVKLSKTFYSLSSSLFLFLQTVGAESAVCMCWGVHFVQAVCC